MTLTSLPIGLRFRSEMQPALSELCFAIKHHIGPYDGGDAVLIVSAVQPFNDLVTSHIDQLKKQFSLRMFGDNHPYVSARSDPRVAIELAELDLSHQGTVIILCEPHLQGYARLALLKRMPCARILCRGYPLRGYGDLDPMCADSWWNYPRCAETIWRVYQKIVDDAVDGVIACPIEVDDLIVDIVGRAD